MGDALVSTGGGGGGIAEDGPEGARAWWPCGPPELDETAPCPPPPCGIDDDDTPVPLAPRRTRSNSS